MLVLSWALLFKIDIFQRTKNMAGRFGSFIKKKLIRANRNLVSLDDPFEVMARLLKDRPVTGVIDAGASDGRISRRLLRRFPAAQAYAFEPNPFYAPALQQYAEQDSRFHPQFLALSDREGDAPLHVTESPGGTSLLTPGEPLGKMDPNSTSVKSLEQIKTVTMDQWAQRNGDPSIQVIKLDIQAAELKALRGAVRVLRNSTLLVYTEIWFNPAYTGGALYSEIDLFLREHRLVLYDIFRPKYDPRGLIMWGNAIFLNTQLLSV
jgi:FkbM family methyltransferase